MQIARQFKYRRPKT